MRKLKKINGYLVVRFNDREKREYEGTGLGNFGVIDAELYTGILDVDRGVMEYDDTETLEIALEQARGLESELDVAEPEVKITVIIEGETEVSELDKALDGATGYPATVLRGALHDRLRELAEMYTSNYAVQQFKEGMQKSRTSFLRNYLPSLAQSAAFWTQQEPRSARSWGICGRPTSNMAAESKASPPLRWRALRATTRRASPSWTISPEESSPRSAASSRPP